MNSLLYDPSDDEEEVEEARLFQEAKNNKSIKKNKKEKVSKETPLEADEEEKVTETKKGIK